MITRDWTNDCEIAPSYVVRSCIIGYDNLGCVEGIEGFNLTQISPAILHVVNGFQNLSKWNNLLLHLNCLNYDKGDLL